jgi:hypothetical protein
MKVKGYEVRFDRRAAERYIEALSAGKPLTPPPEGWSPDDLLTLAGCCAALSEYGSALAMRPASAGLHAERKEALADDIRGGLDAIRLGCTTLAAALLAGTYDALVSGDVYEGVAYRRGREWAFEPPFGDAAAGNFPP